MRNPRESLIERMRLLAAQGGPVAEAFARIADIESGVSSLPTQTLTEAECEPDD